MNVLDRRMLVVVPLLVTSGLAGCGAKTGLTVPDVPMDAPIPMDAPDSPDTPPVCMPGEFPLTPTTADVVFVLDRSGSMQLTLDGLEGFPPDQWRWRVLRDALDGAFATLSDRVRVGAKFFPDVITEFPTPADVACRSSAGIDVPISFTGEARTIGIFDSTEPVGGTPTAMALAEASAALRMAANPRRFIVLATDGGPNCNADSSTIDPDTCICTSLPDVCRTPPEGIFSCLDDDRAVSTVAAAARSGQPVFVIGIDDPSRPELGDVLDRMAIAGERPRTTPGERSFYSVASAAELREALDTITSSISECGFVSPSVPTDESTFFIEIDGVRIPRDGWDWVDRVRGELELGEDACELGRRPGADVIAVVDDCPDV